MKVIVTPNPDFPHNLRITHPAYADQSHAGLSEDEIIQKVIARNKAAGLFTDSRVIEIIDADDLPQPGRDGDLFDAWTLVDRKVIVDQVRAKELGLLKP